MPDFIDKIKINQAFERQHSQNKACTSIKGFTGCNVQLTEHFIWAHWKPVYIGFCRRAPTANGTTWCLHPNNLHKWRKKCFAKNGIQVHSERDLRQLLFRLSRYIRISSIYGLQDTDTWLFYGRPWTIV